MKVICMMGPPPQAKGGIASVIDMYFSYGLLEKWPIIFIPTYIEGGRLTKFFCTAKAVVRFINLLSQNKIALLHVHVARRNSFWRKAIFIQLAFLSACPVLIHLHSGGFFSFYEEECGKLKKFWIKYLLKNSTLIVLTKFWKKNYEIFFPKNIIVIPNFVELPSLNKEPTRPTLIFLGRLTREKGIFDLFEAISLVKPFYPNLLVRLGGESESIDAICRELDRLEIRSNIMLEGWVDGKKKREMMSQATAFVLPSYIEGLPMGVLEAMACGLPVIATRVGGVPDVIKHRVNGVLVDAGQPTELAAEIDYLLSNSSFRDRLARAGRQTVECHYSPEAVLPLLDSIYSDFNIESINSFWVMPS